MKRSLRLIVFTLLCCLVMPVFSQKPVSATTQIVAVPYVNEEKGFSIDFPAGWQFEEGIPGIAVSAMSPSTGAGDTYTEKIIVTVDDLPAATLLSDYHTRVLTDLQRFYGRSFKLLDEKDTAISGVAAKGITYRAKIDEKLPSTLYIACILVREKQGFLITCSCRETDFPRYQKAFMASVLSFKLQTPTGIKKPIKQGFDIRFPDDWKNQYTNEGMFTAMAPSNDGTNFAESVNISVRDLAQNVTLDEVFNWYTEMPKLSKDIKIVSTGKAMLNGTPARYLISTWGTGKDPCKNLCYFIMKGKKLFTINCIASPASFATYKKTFEKIAGTFVITGK